MVTYVTCAHVCIFVKMRFSILKNAKVYPLFQLNAKDYFTQNRFNRVIRESKSLKFRGFFSSRNFLPAKLSPRKVDKKAKLLLKTTDKRMFLLNVQRKSQKI